MNSVKYFRYFKYCLLILCYGMSIIMYSSPSSLLPEIFMGLQLKELFSDFMKMIILSIAINITLAIFTLGLLLAINVACTKFSYYKNILVSSNELSRIKLHGMKENLDGLNPFLYGSKTRCLLE